MSLSREPNFQIPKRLLLYWCHHMYCPKTGSHGLAEIIALIYLQIKPFLLAKQKLKKTATGMDLKKKNHSFIRRVSLR